MAGCQHASQIVREVVTRGTGSRQLGNLAGDVTNRIVKYAIKKRYEATLAQRAAAESGAQARFCSLPPKQQATIPRTMMIETRPERSNQSRGIHYVPVTVRSAPDKPDRVTAHASDQSVVLDRRPPSGTIADIRGDEVVVENKKADDDIGASIQADLDRESKVYFP
jgi:hypothetical protein